jgi:hypothetical protein
MEMVRSNQVEMLEMQTSINQYEEQEIVLSAYKIKMKKEYQRWRT